MADRDVLKGTRTTNGCFLRIEWEAERVLQTVTAPFSLAPILTDSHCGESRERLLSYGNTLCLQSL